MTTLSDKLRKDAEDHMNVAYQCDCRPEDTINWLHAKNAIEAANRIEELERQISKMGE